MGEVKRYKHMTLFGNQCLCVSADAYDALRAENAEIVGLMRNIHRALPTTRCADLHHSKADRHAYNEVCKPLERYMAAQAAIDAALAKHRGE